MTDFLGRLVTRVLAPERLLRPRVQSRYEPAMPVMAFEEVASISPATPSRATTDGGLIARRLERRAAVQRDGMQRQSREPEQARPEPAQLEKLLPHLEVPEPQAAPGRMKSQPSDEAENGESTTPNPIIIEREVVQPPEVHTIVRTRRGADRIERLRLRSERTRVEREPISEAPIEITIGRIDVRAVVDSQREVPRTTRAPQPSLSLRDYLAQRDARRRR